MDYKFIVLLNYKFINGSFAFSPGYIYILINVMWLMSEVVKLSKVKGTCY